MAANYDKIAPVYDLLSRLVYGNSIRKAQCSLVQFIKPENRILLIGGGTGWILEEMAKLHTSGLTIDYVEASAKMIQLAQKKSRGNNTVRFIQTPVEDFSAAGLYDVIFTPFIFDNFNKEKAALIFKKLSPLLKSQGIWLHCDFTGDKKEDPFWQRLLLKIMYAFFRLTTGIETSKLIPIENYFQPAYQKIFEMYFYARFIQATAYRKTAGNG